MKRRRKPIRSPSNAHRRNQPPNNSAHNDTTTIATTSPSLLSIQDDTSTQTVAMNIASQSVEIEEDKSNSANIASHCVEEAESQHSHVDSITSQSTMIIQSNAASSCLYATQFTHPHLSQDLLMYIE